MRKHITLFLLFLIILFSVSALITNAQNIPPALKWQRSYGGSTDEEFRGMLLTADGGFITVGLSSSKDGDVELNYGKNDYWIVKCDSIGNIQWQQVYGGSQPDWGRSIFETSEGGYLVTGYSKSNDGYVTGNHGDYDYWILKLDGLGELIWQKTFGGSAFDNAYRTIETSDGNYLVVGFTESGDGQVSGFHGAQDFWILKLDISGNILWKKTMGGTKKEQASCVIETDDHNYVIAGYAESDDGDVVGHKGLQDMWVVKLTQSGNLLWKKCFGGTRDDGARWIIPAADGSYIISGYSGSDNMDCTYNHGNFDYWVVNISPQGDLLWQKSLGGTEYEYSYHITPDLDGNYLIAGYTFSTDGDVTGAQGACDYWITKIDTTGNLLWQKTFGGSLFDECRVILPKPNGNYILAGFTHSSDGDVTVNYGTEDGWVVEACSIPQNFYADADGDGYGNSNVNISACSLPPGYVTTGTDCNDMAESQHPGAPEFCNGIDDDCNGAIDNNISAPVITAAGSTTFCTGGSVELNAANFSNVASYKWYKNNSQIPGATATSYTAASSGNYFFRVTFQGCAASSNVIEITVNSLPIATINNGPSVTSCKGTNLLLTANPCAGCTYQWYKNGAAISGATSSTYQYNSNSSANFTIGVTSSKGCSSTSGITVVTKVAKPAATITPLGSLDICNTGEVTLQANSGAGFTYKWFKNGTKITGATNQSYISTSTGDYTVRVTNSSSCSQTSAITTVTSSCRLYSEQAPPKIFAAPNPSDGSFDLTLFSTEENKSASLTVTDLVGKVIMKKSVPLIMGETITRLEFPESAADGIYCLRVESEEYVQTLRIVKAE